MRRLRAVFLALPLALAPAVAVDDSVYDAIVAKLFEKGFPPAPARLIVFPFDPYAIPVDRRTADDVVLSLEGALVRAAPDDRIAVVSRANRGRLIDELYAAARPDRDWSRTVLTLARDSWNADVAVVGRMRLVEGGYDVHFQALATADSELVGDSSWHRIDIDPVRAHGGIDAAVGRAARQLADSVDDMTLLLTAGIHDGNTSQRTELGRRLQDMLTAALRRERADVLTGRGIQAVRPVDLGESELRRMHGRETYDWSRIFPVDSDYGPGDWVLAGTLWERPGEVEFQVELHGANGRVAEVRESFLLDPRIADPKSQPGDDLPPGSVFRDCADCPEMVVVRAGSFMMGSPSSEEGSGASEGPQHRVTISEPFAVGVHEVTRGQFGRFVSATSRAMGNSCRVFGGGERENRSGIGWRAPGFGQSDDHPVVCVSWDDAQAYVRWLSGETGKSYRLLSESEWEYAARAGTVSSRYWGIDPLDVCRYANVADLTLEEEYPDWPRRLRECRDGYAHTAPVGSYAANDFGLHEMLGNVVEWTEDCWNGSYNGAPTDGGAWTRGDCSLRVLRGGSWKIVREDTRSAFRARGDTGIRHYDAGFRLARTFAP